MPWYDWIAVAASIVTCGYVVIAYPEMIQDIAATTPDRWGMGGILILLIFEATRRLVGWVLIGLAGAFIVYARFSHLFPGILYAPSTDWDRLGAYFYIDTNAILGLPLTVMGTIVIAFILFGRILYAMHADRVLTEASLAMMGRYRGGPAKVAVGASSLFGTISGSVVSNVVMDGPITIPMMTRSSYKPHMAAAIEAVASTGGQIMPPVMGITAFLIADWLGINYGNVVIAALFPAILYYVALFVQVDLEAAKGGMVGLPADRLPRLWAVVRRGWVFIVPFATLIYTLLVLAWEPGRSAMAAVFAALAVGLLQPETRPSLKTIWVAMVETGQTVLDLIAITAIAGLVIGSLQVSGLAFGLSLILVTIAAGSLLLLLLMTAGLSIGEPLNIVIAVISALVGVFYLAAGLAGYLFAPISRFNRALLVLAGLCLIPSPLDSTLWLVVNVAGLAAGLLVAFRQRMLAASPA